jgi:hypothetical protein
MKVDAKLILGVIFVVILVYFLVHSLAPQQQVSINSTATPSFVSPIRSWGHSRWGPSRWGPDRWGFRHPHRRPHPHPPHNLGPGGLPPPHNLGPGGLAPRPPIHTNVRPLPHISMRPIK